MKLNEQNRPLTQDEIDWQEADGVYDDATLEEIGRELERTVPVINIMDDNTEAMTDQQKEIFYMTKDFCQEVSEVYREDFLRELDSYQKKRRQISPKIIDYIIDKKMIMPEFTLMNWEQGQEFLRENNLEIEEHYHNQENFILVFQLPQCLAKFWWKEGYSFADTRNDSRIIEWGYFYRVLMRNIWGVLGYYECEKDMNFDRVNQCGQHDEDNYYYVWQVDMYYPSDVPDFYEKNIEDKN